MPFPGNDWLDGALKGACGPDGPVGVSRLHGFFRGALAGPLSIPFDEALAALLGAAGEEAPRRKGGLEGTREGLAALWEEIGQAYHRGGVFPPAIPHNTSSILGTDKGNRALAEEIVEFADAFLEGFELAGGAAGGEEGEGKLSPGVEELLDDLDLLLRGVDELDEEIGKEGIVAAQTRLLYEGLAHLEKDMRAIARKERRALPREADPSGARKSARKKRRGEE
jgi:hypothetical protein